MMYVKNPSNTLFIEKTHFYRVFFNYKIKCRNKLFSPLHRPTTQKIINSFTILKHKFLNIKTGILQATDCSRETIVKAITKKCVPKKVVKIYQPHSGKQVTSILDADRVGKKGDKYIILKKTDFNKKSWKLVFIEVIK